MIGVRRSMPIGFLEIWDAPADIMGRCAAIIDSGDQTDCYHAYDIRPVTEHAEIRRGVKVSQYIAKYGSRTGGGIISTQNNRESPKACSREACTTDENEFGFHWFAPASPATIRIRATGWTMWMARWKDCFVHGKESSRLPRRTREWSAADLAKLKWLVVREMVVERKTASF